MEEQRKGTKEKTVKEEKSKERGRDDFNLNGMTEEEEKNAFAEERTGHYLKAKFGKEEKNSGGFWLWY